MLEFIDGPAAGQVLRLMRTPVLIRAVSSPMGKWDALDQPDDVPSRREKIYVYQLVDKPTSMFIQCSPRSASGHYWCGKYRFLPDHQPADFILRDNGNWDAWCESVYDELAPEWYKAAAEELLRKKTEEEP